MRVASNGWDQEGVLSGEEVLEIRNAAANSVVNSFGQTHEIANLWMAGPCIFPTEGASNPTYTIFAVSLRGAEHLATNWGSVAG